ncbi:unnamed protein product [Enterobius vermicularis]|uniref:C2H2-type domain-containing protein n=1 Tax=Enterobius vermicularis TaxID=51028 RepID=A0A0N4VK87_ENTVE|nr:unnamed protein product [Enterobius vermicularis]
MSYQQYESEYLFDQYYFPPTARTTYTATFVPQCDLYGGWPTETALCSSTALAPEANLHWREVPAKQEPTTVFPWVDASSCSSVNAAGSETVFEVTPEETRMHSCPTCHKQYCRKGTLKAHLKQHFGHRPFICQASVPTKSSFSSSYLCHQIFAFFVFPKFLSTLKKIKI